MAIDSRDIETLWQRYSDEGVNKGLSVAQYFESNGIVSPVDLVCRRGACGSTVS